MLEFRGTIFRPELISLEGRASQDHADLTEFERGPVIELLRGGFSSRNIAKTLSRNVSTVHDCWERWLRDGTAPRRSGSGRLRGTTESKDRHIWRTTTAYRTASVAEIRAAVCTTVTQRTVRNQLLQGQARARQLVLCISLTPNHHRLRR
ncbi:HTH_Tnp_Tc3_2 domain-containing protein [Trichonephila clavipes]|nr:HTH_Tnp_Tc3_2 domain-containing protein [Trichonephila clavipes]